MDSIEIIQKGSDVLSMLAKMLKLNDGILVDISQDSEYGFIRYKGNHSSVVIKISNSRLEDLSMVDPNSQACLVLYDNVLKNILEHREEPSSYNLICID